MHIFARSKWGVISRRSTTSERVRSELTRTRVREKHGDKRLAVLDVLEVRGLIGSFLGEVAVTAGGVAAARRQSDLFGESAWVDFAVAGDSTDEEPTHVCGGTGSLDTGMALGASQDQPGRPTETDILSMACRVDSLSDLLSADAPGLNSLPSTINSTLLASAFDDVVPRMHGDFRTLPLLPPAGGGAGSSGFVAATNGVTVQRDSEIEIPSRGNLLSANRRISAEPFVPPIQPTANGLNDSSQAESSASLPAVGVAGVESGGGSADRTDGSADNTDDSGAWMRASAGGGGVETPQSANAGPGALGFEMPGQDCSIDAPPGQSGEAGGPPGLGADFATLNSKPSTPVVPPCAPPGPMSFSAADPLFVLNWNDGLVMAPGVAEYDQPDQWQDLRAQVYGATVSSYSWDTSQASSATCVTGSSSQRLQFKWNTVTGSTWLTNTITVTATMTDQSTKQMTLTFKVAPGTAAFGCTSVAL
jgi:hypothetical protein